MPWAPSGWSAPGKAGAHASVNALARDNMCARMKGMVRASASAAREQRVGHKNATGLCAIDVLLLTLNCAKNEVDWMEAMDSIFLNQGCR